MIKHVYDICVATGIDTYIATTDKEIAKLFDFNVIDVDGVNGTDRCANAAKKLDYDHFINVQGDFVGVSFAIINSVVHALTDTGVTTAHATYEDHHDDHDPVFKANKSHDRNTVHVIIKEPASKEPAVTNVSYEAAWFTRADIRYGHKHYGIYGFHKNVLLQYNDKYTSGISELAEQLEQLRWIDMGIVVESVNIDQWISPLEVADINTPEDLEDYNEAG